MILSNMTAIWVGVTSSPVSSNISRMIASSTRSPVSTAPPGSDHCPFKGSLPRSIKRTRSALKISAPTPRTGRGGYRRLSFASKLYCRSRSPGRRLTKEGRGCHTHRTFPPAQVGRRFINTLTEEKTDQYDHEKIDEKYLAKKVTDFNKYFYICGPDPMVEAIHQDLLNLGVKEEKIVIEEF